MSLCDGLGPSVFCLKMESTHPMRKKMDGKVFISRQIRHFYFDILVMKILYFICTLTWPVNNYFYRQRKSINKETKVSWDRTVIFVPASITSTFKFFATLNNLIPEIRVNSVFNAVWLLFLQMATLRKKRKLAAMNRENYEESSRSTQSRDKNIRRI